MKKSPILLTVALTALFGSAAFTPLLAQSSAPAAERDKLRQIDAPQTKSATKTTPSARRTTPARFDEKTQATTARVQFSDPAKPGTLKFSLPWAQVKITGTDASDVVVSSTLGRKADKAQVDEEGFRRLDDEVSFDLTESKNVVSLAIVGDHHWGSHGAEFTIQVPRNTNLIVRTHAGGDIDISNIDGDIDVNSMNGEVTLTDISSSAVINTMNGEVTATFRRAPTKPVSITTMNGEIDLRLPADTKANVRLRTHNGSIRTNFPETALQTKTESTPRRVVTGRTVSVEESREIQQRIQQEVSRSVRDATHAAQVAGEAAAAAVARARAEAGAVAPVAPTPPTPPAFGGGKSIAGSLNGGGTDISLSTMNGTITLRQLQP